MTLLMLCISTLRLRRSFRDERVVRSQEYWTGKGVWRFAAGGGLRCGATGLGRGCCVPSCLVIGTASPRRSTSKLTC